MSYFPTSWTILQTRHEKGSLHKRCSVLFWNQQMSWRATTPGQYLWGLLNSPALRNSFMGALHPTISQNFFWAGSSPTVVNGPSLVAISANCLIGDDSGDLPIYSIFSPPLSFAQPCPELGALCSGRCGRCCMNLCPGSYSIGPSLSPFGVILVCAILE